MSWPHHIYHLPCCSHRSTPPSSTASLCILDLVPCDSISLSSEVLSSLSACSTCIAFRFHNIEQRSLTSFRKSPPYQTNKHLDDPTAFAAGLSTLRSPTVDRSFSIRARSIDQLQAPLARAYASDLGGAHTINSLRDHALLHHLHDSRSFATGSDCPC